MNIALSEKLMILLLIKINKQIQAKIKHIVPKIIFFGFVV